MIEIEASTVDPFILSIRLVFNMLGVLVTTGTFIALLLSWRQNGLFGRLITIFVGATSLGSLSATYIRIVTLNPEVLNFPNHWQMQIIPSIAVNAALAIFVPVAITLHLACLEANIQHKRWVKIVLFVNYFILISRTLVAIVVPSSMAQSITISASRDLSFVRQPHAIIYTLNALITIALTVFVIVRWRVNRIWQFALNNFAVIASWIWLQTAFGQLFSGLHTTAVLVLAAIHMAIFSFRSPETNVARRLSLQKQELLQAEQQARQHAEAMFEMAQTATAELKAATEARQALEIAAAIQAERDRIGRETHDGLLQRLSGARLRIERWPSLLGTDHNPALSKEFNILQTELLRGTTDLRQLIHGLHQGESQTTFGQIIADTITLVEATYNVTVHNFLSFDPSSFEKDAEHELARIVQEAITNAGKHAQATEIWLTDAPWSEPAGIHIEIRDNGCGFDETAAGSTSSFGLKNMQIRTALLDGRFRIESNPDVGTSIHLTIPFDQS